MQNVRTFLKFFLIMRQRLILLNKWSLILGLEFLVVHLDGTEDKWLCEHVVKQFTFFLKNGSTLMLLY